MTPEQVHELLDNATPGPWEALATYDDGSPRPDTTREMRAAGEYLGIMHTPNADLAAAAPELAKQVLNYHYAVGQLRHLLTMMADTDAVKTPPRASELYEYVIWLLTEIMEVTQK